MQALRILGSLQCVREFQRPQTRRRIFLGSTSGALSTTILGIGGPAPSLSTVTFFVNCDLLRQLQFWSHHLPRSATQAVPVRRFPSITKCLSCPTFALHNSVLSWMTNKDSLSHAPCKLTDTVFSNFTEPNFLSKLRHWLSPPSTRSPHFTRLILILIMTCAAKRRSQLSHGLSSAMRTLVFCSAEIRSVVHCRFTSLTAISTRPLAM